MPFKSMPIIQTRRPSACSCDSCRACPTCLPFARTCALRADRSGGGRRLQPRRGLHTRVLLRQNVATVCPVVETTIMVFGVPVRRAEVETAPTLKPCEACLLVAGFASRSILLPPVELLLGSSLLLEPCFLLLLPLHILFPPLLLQSRVLPDDHFSEAHGAHPVGLEPPCVYATFPASTPHHQKIHEVCLVHVLEGGPVVFLAISLLLSGILTRRQGGLWRDSPHEEQGGPGGYLELLELLVIVQYFALVKQTLVLGRQVAMPLAQALDIPYGQAMCKAVELEWLWRAAALETELRWASAPRPWCRPFGETNAAPFAGGFASPRASRRVPSRD
mmetsp:Transcript_75124/g.208943  ORF Transcript_75124/g.208943 Transcript_75124/m.208943 type:complete len:333 (-) Transcript_75124:508-1506(-)